MKTEAEELELAACIAVGRFLQWVCPRDAPIAIQAWYKWGRHVIDPRGLELEVIGHERDAWGQTVVVCRGAGKYRPTFRYYPTQLRDTESTWGDSYGVTRRR